MGFKDAIGMVGAVTDLSFSLGMSQGEAAKLVGIMTMATGLSEEGAVQLAKQTEMLATANNVAPAKVMKEVAQNTEFFAKFGKDGGKNIGLAAIQASKLGIGLDKVSGIMGGLLDFQSSLQAEMEASVLIGRQLNYSKARELALNNDITGAMKEVVGQLGSEEEFTKLNAIQREALAKSIGVGVEELAKFVEKGKEGADVTGDISNQDFSQLVGTDAISNLTQLTNSFKEMGAVLVKSVGPTLGWIAGMFSGLAKWVTDSSAAMIGLKGVLAALAPVMAVLAVKSMILGISKLFQMVASIGASTMGFGMIGGIAAAAGLIGAAASWRSSAESTFSAATGADFVTNGPTNLVVGDNPTGKEHVQVTPIPAPGGGNASGNLIMTQVVEVLRSQNALLNSIKEQDIETRSILVTAISDGAKDSAKQAGIGVTRAALGNL